MNVESQFAGARVVVTGGAGFIGSHLTTVLCEAGAEVLVLDNLSSGVWSNLDDAPAARRVECDLGERSRIAESIRDWDPRFVFHFAANASVPGSVEDPDTDFDSNAVGTHNVLRACRGLDRLEKLVLASSAAVYGEPAEHPIRESTPIRPISPYGFSKLASEGVVACHHRVYGVPAVAARIFNVYGPRMARFVVLDFLRKLRARPDVLTILGSGEQIRELTYVRDAVSAFLCLAVHGVPGDVVNVSGGSPLSIRELAQLIIALRGLRETCSIETTGTSWVGDAQRWTTDTSKLAGLGFAPAWTIESGLRRTIEWFDATEQS